jgi:hypothetical protein
MHEIGVPWDSDASELAALGGHKNILEYMHNNLGPFDMFSPALATKGGQLECLKFLHSINVEWDETTLKLALDNKNYDCFTFAVENGCKLCHMISKIVCKDHNVEIAPNAHDPEAEPLPKVHILRYIIDKNCPIHSECKKIVKGKKWTEMITILDSCDVNQNYNSDVDSELSSESNSDDEEELDY